MFFFLAPTGTAEVTDPASSWSFFSVLASIIHRHRRRLRAGRAGHVPTTFETSHGTDVAYQYK